MKYGTIILFLFVIGIFLSSSVVAMANPASVYCVDQGYRLENRINYSSGFNYTVCVFPNGSECEEWKFYKGDCGIEYKKNMPCRKAGEEIRVWSCCNGLIPINRSHPIENGKCSDSPIGSWNICSDCGNKVCESWENICNCPSDCITNIAPQEEKDFMLYILGLSTIIFVFILYFLFVYKKK